MRKILISGYYGFDNFGDDAILHTLLLNIKTNIPDSQITVISKNPVKIKQTYGVDSVYTFDYKEILSKIMNSDLFISGGGSLLQDVTSLKSLFYYLALIFLAKLFNVKTYIYAQGIGPIKNKFGRILTGFILKRANLITVRDKKSKDFLSRLGVDSILTADPVWDIRIEHENDSSLEPSEIKVGVQLRNWYSLDDKKLDSIADALNSSFNSPDYQLVLISLQDSLDLEVTKRLQKLIKDRNPTANVELKSDLSIFDSISLIYNLDYLVAMRYHACLVSLKFNIPTLALSYDPKVESLSSEAGIPHISIDNLSEEELNGKISVLVSEKTIYEDKIKDFSAKKEVESRQNTELLSKILFEEEIVRG